VVGKVTSGIRLLPYSSTTKVSIYGPITYKSITLQNVALWLSQSWVDAARGACW